MQMPQILQSTLHKTWINRSPRHNALIINRHLESLVTAPAVAGPIKVSVVGKDNPAAGCPILLEASFAAPSLPVGARIKECILGDGHRVTAAADLKEPALAAPGRAVAGIGRIGVVGQDDREAGAGSRDIAALAFPSVP